MATQSPFSWVGEAAGKLGALAQPPSWLIEGAQHRLVLFINHVLQQEPEAQRRLAAQSGRVVRIQWRGWSLQLMATPAGLAELAPAATPDLLFTVTEGSPLDLAAAALRGERPAVRIEGDVAFAAEVNWLVDHVRWDAEDDLARFVGDGPAHAVAAVAGTLAGALRGFVAKVSKRGRAAGP